MKEVIKISRLLLPYYNDLNALIKKGEIKKAEKYLNDLPPGLYDLIVESSINKTLFCGILTMIDKSKKRDCEKDRSHKGLPKDDNSIF